jgi:pimeloyl-ACP methyl ester carboxylesterase
MLHRRHLHLDGLRVAYLEKGSPSPAKPSLVLLHGLMGCAETFAPLMESLPGYHIVALDLPGAGRSERRADIDPGLAATAGVVGNVLNALELQRPVLLGHSHGGAVAMHLAATQPGLLHSLVLFAPAHPYFRESDPVIRFYLSLPGRLFAYSMPWYPQWMQMMGLRRMAGPQSWDTPERLKPYRENLRTPGTVEHLLRLLRGWKKDMESLRQLLRKPLSTPVKLVWGDCDRAVPFRSSTELRKRLVVSEFQVLSGVGHRPSEEQPELVAGIVAEWIERLEPTLEQEVEQEEIVVPAYSPVYAPGPSASPSPNSFAIHDRMAAFITSSFEFGESAVPAKK